MSNSLPAKRRPAPLSIRFTDAEKAVLRQKAGGIPLGSFIRQLVLGPDAGGGKGRKYPVRDGEALGHILGLLGQSRLANNLNQLAKAAHLGALPVSEETEADLKTACAEVAMIRRLLLKALGVVTHEMKPNTAPLASVFTGSAGGPS
jgi:hypothetical protein